MRITGVVSLENIGPYRSSWWGIVDWLFVDDGVTITSGIHLLLTRLLWAVVAIRAIFVKEDHGISIMMVIECWWCNWWMRITCDFIYSFILLRMTRAFRRWRTFSPWEDAKAQSILSWTIFTSSIRSLKASWLKYLAYKTTCSTVKWVNENSNCGNGN